MENDFTPIGLTNCSRQLYQDNEHVLIKFTEGTSDKFWAAIPDEGNYIVMWGKNGKSPQGSQVINKWEAQDRLAEKVRSGYEFCRSNELLYTFQTNPKWFAKVKGSPKFTSAVKAQQLQIDLQIKANKPEKKQKLKI